MPIRIAQGSPPHWALRASGALVIAYIALSPLFRDLTPSEFGELTDIAVLALATGAAVAQTGPFSAEFRIRRHDGVHRRFDGRGVPMRDESGVVVKWFGSNTELTPQSFKELTGLTRKGAIPLLEWLDRRRLTRRDGDRRVPGPGI